MVEAAVESAGGLWVALYDKKWNGDSIRFSHALLWGVGIMVLRSQI